jgi:sterol desaturase/sphingolipid hydroxylase (fatty acid hydroxylase superfamily)
MLEKEWIMSNDELAESIGLLVPLMLLAMLAAEATWPARVFPPAARLALGGPGFLVLIATTGAVVRCCCRWTGWPRTAGVDGTRSAWPAGTLAGWIVLSLIGYGYHRLCHASPLMWRLSHQIHHAPQRVDISGSVVFHPLEMVVQTLFQLSSP